MALPQRYIEKSIYTEDEYLQFEAEMPYKSEYVRGEIRAMSGGTDDHATISGNAVASLWVALRGRGCRVMTSDMKVFTPRNTFRYPDASVVCGPRQYHGRSKSIITNPLVLVEVLSDSTSLTDHTEKLAEYQFIDTLQSYLLVSQDVAYIEHYARLADSQWVYSVAEGLAATLTIPALGITLALADIYDGIDFNADRD